MTMGSRTLTCHPAEVCILAFASAKLVLDLATLQGCRAELTLALE